MKLKNKCFATIYGMVLSGKTVREIHKRIYSMTAQMPRMYLLMSKVASKTSKTVDHRKNADENSEIILLLFGKMGYNGKAKHLINHETMETAEKSKHEVIKSYIKESESLDRWIYLASSHVDCAEDHVPFQGKLYYDNKAPEYVVEYARKHGYRSIQWVMDAPAWFITRPNCRHFFKSLPLDVVKQYSIKELQRRYKTHRMTGDTTLATPRKVAIEEYKDRLDMLKAMYHEHPTESLRRQINKIKILLKKWENKL